MSLRTEQEQLEAFRQWWKNSGWQTLGAITLALLAYAGWAYWQHHQHNRAEAASALYQDVLKNPATTTAHSDALAKLRADYGDTFYGQSALLFLAQDAVGRSDLEAAEKLLDELIRLNPSDDLAYTARLRSARVLYSLGKHDAALARLEGEIPPGFNSLFAELRGDIYAAKNQPDEARKAYEEALAADAENERGNKDMLEMKLSQVGAR